MRVFARSLSWFVPEPRFSEEERARARTFVMACFSIALMLGLAATTHQVLARGLLPDAAAPTLCATLLALPFALRMSGNLTLVATLGAATIAIGPVIAAFASGLGVHAPMMVVTTVTPVLAAAFVGRVGALVSCAVSLLTIACAQWLIAPSEAVKQASESSSGLVALGLAMLVALSGYFSWLFELERARASKHVDESEARFRRLAEEARDIVCRLRVSPSLKLEYVNAAFERTLGYPREQAQADLDGFAERVIHPDDLAAIVNRGGNGFGEPVVCRVKSAAGRELWMETRLVASHDEHGALVLEGISRDVTSQKHLELELAFRATHDPVTGLLNRRAFEQHCARMSLACPPRRFSVLYIDLDHFKKVNDTHGHDAGDTLLTTVGKRISRVVRACDEVYRLGGDEFAVVLPDTLDERAGAQVGERIVACLERPFRFDSLQMQVKASVGLAVWSIHGSTPEELLEAADRAMYRAKRGGGGRLVTALHALARSGIRKTPVTRSGAGDDATTGSHEG